MYPGEVAEVYCPGELDQGGNIDIYSNVNTDEWSHRYTDMNYIFEVRDCNLMLEEPGPVRIQGPIESGRCIFIVTESAVDGKMLAMQTDTVDQYAPRKTGVFNVVLREWGGMDSTEANQQWTYHAEDQSL